MNNINLESSKFNYYLNKIADESYAVDCKDGNLIVCKYGSSPQGKLEERISVLVKYIISHSDNINNHQIELIDKIKNNLLIKIVEQDLECKKNILSIIEQLNNISPSKTGLIQSPASMPGIALFIAPPPSDKKAFAANLRLVLEHYPKYQLHNDLSVFDSSYGSIPEDWSYYSMMETLQDEFRKYELFEVDRVTHLSSIKEEILPVLKRPEPVKMSIIIETSPVGTGNSAMMAHCAYAIQHEVPCLLNREFFQIQAKNINKEGLNFDKVQIYVQKQGDLCLLMPSWRTLQSLGFNEDQFELSEGEHWKPSGHPLRLADDLKAALISETSNEKFLRFVEFQGHGSYPGYPNDFDASQEGIIAGLPMQEFQECLISLKERNMAFMVLGSCYAAGSNITDIHLPNQIIPCPIYVCGSFETVTYSENTLPILKAAEKMVCPSKVHDSNPIALHRHITKSDMKRLMRLPSHTKPALKFSNLGTLLLPANLQDIPKVAYTLADPEEILDISRAQRERWSSLHSEELQKTLEDKNPSRKAYVLSEPIVPFTLKVSGTLPMILLSRGGSAQHVIKEIIAPQQDIVDIAKETFNAFFHLESRDAHEEPASKAYFIASIQCHYEGKPVKLSHVMMVNEMKKRYILFKIEGEEDFHRVYFDKSDKPSKGYLWNKGKVETVSLNEALMDIYMAQAVSAPSSKVLRQMTAGRKSQLDILEALNTLFFPRMPPAAKLYSAILQVFYGQTISVENVLKEVDEELRHARHRKRHLILENAYEISLLLNLSEFTTAILKFSSTPLMQAVKVGDLERAKVLLKNDPQSLEARQVSGSTALMWALIFRQFDMAKWLIEQGADMLHINKSNVSAFQLACKLADLPFIEWMLLQKADFQGSVGAKVLNNVIEQQEWDVAHLLVDQQVGSNDETIPLLTTAVYNFADQHLITKLLSYPKMDINQVNQYSNTALHVSVLSSNLDNVMLLLDRNADPSCKNNRGYTPLHFVSLYVQKNAMDYVDSLLKAGAFIDAKDNEGMTPLHWSVKKKNTDIVEFLIKRGASLQIQDINQKTPLDYALETPGLLETILRVSGVKVPELPKTSLLAKIMNNLHSISTSAASRSYSSVRAVVDVARALSPLLLAIGGGSKSMVAYLIEKGADVNYANKFDITPLIAAVNDNNPGIVNLLIDKGADVNHPDKDGNTALHLAVALGLAYKEAQILPLIELLINKRVPFDVPNKTGLTAKDLAIKMRLGKVVQLMKS